MKSNVPSIVVSMVLYFAVVAKTTELVFGRNLDSFFFGSRVLVTAIVIFELYLATWLISGFRPKMARVLGLLAFACFATANIFKIFTGGDECGCFGFVKIHPLLALVLNLVCIALINSWKPKVNGVKFPFVSAVVLLVLASALGVFVYRSSPVILGSVGKIIGNRYVALDPAQWLESKLPILPFLTQASRLEMGSWILVLQDPHCDKCRDVIAELNYSDDTRIAIVNLKNTNSEFHEGNQSIADLVDRLDPNYEWYASVPVVLELHDGKVQRVTSE